MSLKFILKKVEIIKKFVFCEYTKKICKQFEFFKNKCSINFFIQ